MRKNYQNQEIDTSQPAVPDTVSVALAELAGEMREGLLALAVGTGLQVMAAIMEADVTAVCGPKGRHDPERTATRHGHGAGSVSLGGRRVPVQRPRMRAVDGSGELPVAAYELFSDTEVLGRMALDRMLAGLSTRHYRVGLEPVGARTETGRHGTSRSAVSRRFVAQTQTALAELLAADLSAAGPGGVHGRRGLRYGAAFSRGALIRGKAGSILQLSGTAAIDEQGKSLFPADICGQINCTLDKIAGLMGQVGACLGDIAAATVFVKRPEYAAVFHEIAADRGLQGLPAVCVLADICRDELLFEMDAEAVITK